jgi:hypothetical protein
MGQSNIYWDTGTRTVHMLAVISMVICGRRPCIVILQRTINCEQIIEKSVAPLSALPTPKKDFFTRKIRQGFKNNHSYKNEKEYVIKQ